MQWKSSKGGRESILLRHLRGTAAPEYASFSISQQITWPIEARAGRRWEAALHDLAMGALEKVEHHQRITRPIILLRLPSL